MNSDLPEVKTILSRLRDDYRKWTGGRALREIWTATERDLIAEIYSRLKDFGNGRRIQVHCDVKPTRGDASGIDVAILTNRDGTSWLETAIRFQNKSIKGRHEALLSTVPVRFWHTAIEVAIPGKRNDIEKSLKKLKAVYSRNKFCHCFLIVLNAGNQEWNREPVVRLLKKGRIAFLEFSTEVEEAEKKAAAKTSAAKNAFPRETIGSACYAGNSLEEIQRINPFAKPGWLAQRGNLTVHRKKQIDRLFKKNPRLTSKYIDSLPSHAGRYPVFLAIAHGLAGWDANLQEVTLLSDPE